MHQVEQLIRTFLVLVLAAPLWAGPQHAQAERHESLLERLEIGISALEEIGDEQALNAVRRVKERLLERAHAERAPGHQGLRRVDAKGLEDLARRVDILRIARKAHEEVGNESAVHALENAVRYGELSLAQAGEQQLAEALQAIPNQGELIGLLREAASAYGEWGKEERGRACQALADFYTERARGRQSARQPDRVEADTSADWSTAELTGRMEILEIARSAHAEAGHAEAAQVLGRFLEVAEMQRDGASGAELARAFEGLSMASVVELIKSASELWMSTGSERRALACADLANYYTQRDRARTRQQAPEREARNVEERSDRLEILSIARAAHREAGDERAADILERVLRVGNLQREGASDAEVGQAAEGLSMDEIIDLIGQAARLYAERGDERRARDCQALAGFYAKREAGGSSEGEEEVEADESSPEGDAELEQLYRQLEALQRQLRDMEAALERLTRDPK